MTSDIDYSFNDKCKDYIVIIMIYQSNIFDVPFLTKLHREFVLWFFTGTKCNLSCSHCYVESSPTNESHPYLTMNTFNKSLQSVIDQQFTTLEFYFTGGEPFMNPDIIEMLHESMKYGNTTVLTNGTKITDNVIERLSLINNNSKFDLTIRVSLDGSDATSNDIIRGKNSFQRANQAIDKLQERSIKVIVTAMRSWSLLKSKDVEDSFIQLLVNRENPLPQSSLKILPPLRIGREIIRDRGYKTDELFTESCFDNYDFSNLQCSKCRMVTEKGVWVCPILVNEDSGRMGDKLEDSFKPYAMKNLACWTCRMEGMVCTND
ncbi:MAG: radical SAM protein [Candidatus Heimdallarchaeota archaeon]|nr:radical SAM protein [Candidatus Heimdallarchaeota archaeon]